MSQYECLHRKPETPEEWAAFWEALEAYFPEDRIELRPLSKLGEGKKEGDVRCFAYGDADDCIMRLLQVAGAEHVKHELQVISASCVKARFTLFGDMVIEGIGEAESGGKAETTKSAETDAIKRTLKKWGIQRYLWTETEEIWAPAVQIGSGTFLKKEVKTLAGYRKWKGQKQRHTDAPPTPSPSTSKAPANDTSKSAPPEAAPEKAKAPGPHAPQGDLAKLAFPDLILLFAPAKLGKDINPTHTALKQGFADATGEALAGADFWKRIAVSEAAQGAIDAAYKLADQLQRADQPTPWIPDPDKAARFLKKIFDV